MNSYCVAHMLAQKIAKATKSLIICYFIFILKSYVDELKWHINSEWAAVSHAVIERASVLTFVLQQNILSTFCNEDDVMWHVWLFKRQ